ncbi:MAG TPA: hypothetical protein VFU23_14515, partial [Gemmatimonadales bacterium]|nr:hypothetical protein [Gemmatimonadales bacterium]
MVGIEGLQSGVPAAVMVTGSQGYQKQLTTGQTLTGLSPGNYAITATEITAAGDHYAPAPASQSVMV